MNAIGGAFLGGASGRLLPASVPLRFFGTAAACHVLAWLALALAPGDWLQFAGGLGWPLAGLHLLTLGVFGMTALGAAAQLLPVATRQAPVGERALAAIWWFYSGGLALLALGMGLARPSWLLAGGSAVGAALAAWSLLVARHLLGARGMPGVLMHAWGALASLLVLLASALLLIAGWQGWPAPARAELLPLHLLFAPFGFMGLLVLGLSYILVPMFTLAHPTPSERLQLASGGLVMAGLLLGAAAVLMPDLALLRGAAWAAGSTGVLLHLVLMRRSITQGMRKSLGRSFVLLHLGWGALLLTLVLGGVLWAGVDDARLRAGFALALLAWLLSTVLGFMQRILPFLAALHAAAGRRRGPTASSLTHEPSLRVHFACHAAAFGLLALAVLLQAPLLARLAAVVGLAGAGAFAAFHVHLLRRLRAARN
ncbi:hypothetical protein PE066_06750 [Ramlibacter tataouinensis]|uniref:hypothetical protein n=1 Tax=Ramlibacter tataouinensis TaxID=94132 RepID=UPI0022F3FFBF|nr:hypothetical protein [Ramlibacter tataouinensis]WBY03227.1 hypothetical protein PE066_06750 [Ramlibacter tataouinensis]